MKTLLIRNAQCVATRTGVAHCPCSNMRLGSGIAPVRRMLGFAGGVVHDPVSALMLCASAQASHTVVDGWIIVRDGRLCSVDPGPLLEHHNGVAMALAM